jgi:DMSO/TMAO reductase YedYZ molybdopterin-dependent catalytic subunit
MSTPTERGIHELYAEDPERADRLLWGRRVDPVSRRGFLRGSGLAAVAAAVGATIPFARNMPGGLIPAAMASELADFQIPGKEGLVVHNDRPLNAETPAHLLDDDVTPILHHFIRNNGHLPEMAERMDAEGWKLRVDGEVHNPLELTLADLKDRGRFTQVRYRLQIECGGNGRAGFDPAPRGNQWTVGAIGNAEWTGVPVAEVLEAAGLKPSAVYTANIALDPHLSGDPARHALSRGVPIAKALEPHSIIAYEMNGEPLHPQNGFPVRLVHPGWPGSTSAKWIERLWIRDQEHDGAGMTGLSYRMPRYPVAPGEDVPHEDMLVIHSMPVKSVITRPQTGTETPLHATLEVRGHAWAGDLEVRAVEVSVDFGVTWRPTTLHAPHNRYDWQRFETRLRFPQRGYYEVWARATDTEDNAQPMVVPGWNPRGYLNNSAHRVAVRVV